MVRAVVDAGAIVTSYLLAGPRGTGAPVLLLRPAGDTDVAEGSLLPKLATLFRVVACRPPLMDEMGGPARGLVAAFSTWLREFLDGLGISRASIVAEGAFGVPALSFALSDPTRVGRLVLLFRDAPDPALPGAAATDLLGRSGHPLLVLRANGAAPSATDVSEVIRFLSEESHVTAER
jgi:hypothetical protein